MVANIMGRLRIGLYIKSCFVPPFWRATKKTRQKGGASQNMEVTKCLYRKEDIQVQDRVKEEVLRKSTCKALPCVLIANHPNCLTAYAAYAAITKAGK